MTPVDASGPNWSWDDYTVLDELPPEGSGFVVLDEMFDAILLSWFAGPQHVVRCRSFLQREGPRESEVADDGSLVMVQRKWTAADRAGLDQHVDDELAEAGLPPRPHGFEWFLFAPGFSSFMKVRALKEREFLFAPQSTQGAVDQIRWLADRVVATFPVLGV